MAMQSPGFNGVTIEPSIHVVGATEETGQGYRRLIV
jgi:hypothetical protein